MRWIGAIALLILAIFMINKGFALQSVNVDGDGIGIYFLGMEINDRVPKERIAHYAQGFFIFSIFPALPALLIIGKSLFQLKMNKQVTR